jgi:oxygen-independent coproporphyrinogen-3 oxidase
MRVYADFLARRLRDAAGFGKRWASLYFGGGTPSALPPDALKNLLSAAATGLKDTACEYTFECNPGDVTPALAALLAAHGINRVSLGLQSAAEAERRALGRRSGAVQCDAAIRRLQAAGISNLSLDVMLGIPLQTPGSLEQTLRFCAEAGAAHISAYLLKTEEGTRFAVRPPPGLPDEDAQAELYVTACGWLQEHGYAQYEIANFAKAGFASRHNLVYWNAEPYDAFGPGAHGFLEGRRWHFPRDLDAYLRGAAPVADGGGGDFAEYAMLRLRLVDGLREDLTRKRFGHGIPAEMRLAAAPLQARALLCADAAGIRLNRKGFLLSNTITAALLENIDSR